MQWSLFSLAPLFLFFAAHLQTYFDPQVLNGPYEHHSNSLPWREAGCLVVDVEEVNIFIMCVSVCVCVRERECVCVSECICMCGGLILLFV